MSSKNELFMLVKILKFKKPYLSLLFLIGLNELCTSLWATLIKYVYLFFFLRTDQSHVFIFEWVYSKLQCWRVYILHTLVNGLWEDHLDLIFHIMNFYGKIIMNSPSMNAQFIEKSKFSTFRDIFCRSFLIFDTIKFDQVKTFLCLNDTPICGVSAPLKFLLALN